MINSSGYNWSLMKNPVSLNNNLYWIGGSPCSGKSSISRILADRFGLAL